MTSEKSKENVRLKDACCVLTQSSSANLSKVVIDALWYAVSSSKSSHLRNLIEFSSDILATHDGGKLLWYAIDKGDLEMATILVRAGANLNVRKPDCPAGMSFLHYMAEQGNSKGYHKLALLMLEKGADVNARDLRGLCVLFYAVYYDSINLAKEISRSGALIDAYNKEHSTSVLLLALEKTNAEHLLEWLVYSIEDEVTRHERSMFITEYYIDGIFNTQLVKKMLDRGLPVDYVNPYGWTLLNRAITRNRIDVIELLLEYGADVNKVSSIGFYPLFLAVGSSKTFVTELLIKRGANIHASIPDGEFAIHWACESQSAKNIQLLLLLGADINVTNKQGRTPLSLVKAENLSMAGIIVIKHLALLNSMGLTVNESDMKLIAQRPLIRKIHEICSKQLEKMQNEKIWNNVSYFSLVAQSSNELFTHLRNEELFVEIFNDKIRQTANSFPLYFEHMKLKLKIAVKKKKLLSSTKTLIHDIFPCHLPSLVIDKIADYTCFDEWKILERNHYLELREIL